MNPPKNPRSRFFNYHGTAINSRSGVALVIVLGMLVLVVVLVIAFLSSVSTELQSSKSYASGSDVRALADSAVNIVISQIQDATSATSNGVPLAWASQPGMIRTYGSDGNIVTNYKLYSSGSLQIIGAYNPVANLSNEILPSWASSANTDTYTDLNKPVTVGTGTAAITHYPIIDPNAVASGTDTSTSLTGTSTPIEGCFINDTSTQIIATSSNQSNPIPMPVEWLYVLKDGSIASIDPNTKKIAGAGAVLADKTINTVVGRIAFWTDDETCKVNINTASEGTYWARPWTDGSYPANVKWPNITSDNYEIQLSTNMPTQNEFQRFPGHPATTCLSTIFPRLATDPVTSYNPRIYGIIPRVADGGSKEGTVNTSQTTSPIVPDNDRLFASVDEFLFSGTSISSGTRQPNPITTGSNLSQNDLEKTRFFLTANSRAPDVNLFNKPRVTLWPLQANTGNVNDPTNATARNSKDKLIAFCSTIGSGANALPYYFQRYDTYNPNNPSALISSQSSTEDWNQITRNRDLYTYLHNLTTRAIPGLGGKLSDKYPGSKCDQILTEMFDFIRSSENTFNTAETSSYFYTPFDPNSLVAGQSQVVPLQVPTNGTRGFGRFPTIVQAALVIYAKDPLTLTGTLPPNGTVIINNGTNQISSGMIYNNYPIPESVSKTMILTGSNYTISSDTSTSSNLGAVLILQPFNPAPGPPLWSPDLRVAISGLGSFNMGFPTDTTVNLVNGLDTEINATAQSNLELYLEQPPRKPKSLGPTNADSPDPQYYPFYGSFTVSGSTFNFSGGDITIKLYQGTVRALNDLDLVQTINMTFPPVTGLPIPRLGKMAYNAKNGATTITMASSNPNLFTDFTNRMSYLRNSKTSSMNGSRWGIAEDTPGVHGPLPYILANGSDLGDVVRSVEARPGGPARGDYRLYAVSGTVPADYFEGHGFTDQKDVPNQYSVTGLLYSGTGMLVHSLRVTSLHTSDTTNSNGYYQGAGGAGDLRGKLLSGASYPDPNIGNNARNGYMPAIPRGITNALMLNGILGDWDTGIGTQVDGPYINKADEGNANRELNTNHPGLYYESGGYLTGTNVVETGASFSPNRQIASAVSFGSLPSGIDPGNPDNSEPWRTLLFCKNPLGGSAHPGFGTPLSGPPYTTPPDHAFLDLFTMPVIEPYAISEPFSTAGKVNMNYQIVPFTYLTRDTAVRAVLKSTMVMAIPTNAGLVYKNSTTTAPTPSYRYTINPDEKDGTLAGFEKRFGAGDIFRSASEICDIWLVPGTGANATAAPLNDLGNLKYSNMEQWWLGGGSFSSNGYKLTGDNVREEPYGSIYPHLTTKSNTYTVHVQTQAIKKASNTPVDQFVDGKDQVTGEFRGSFIIERYLDPNSDSLVNVTTKQPTNENDPAGVVGPYKFRILSTKRFAP